MGTYIRKRPIDGLAFPLPLKGGGSGWGSCAAFAVLVEKSADPLPQPSP